MKTLNLVDKKESKLNEILAERQKTHGDFEEVSRVYAEISKHHSGILNVQVKCALDMIAMKMARIICGNPLERDHWIDIQGYCELVIGGIDK
jgi:hypothetical protein